MVRLKELPVTSGGGKAGGRWPETGWKVNGLHLQETTKKMKGISGPRGSAST